MRDMRLYKRRGADLNDVRGKLLGAALVAFGVIAFGAYGFAAGGEQPKPSIQQTASKEIRTTPDNPGQADMPPPVAPATAE